MMRSMFSGVSGLKSHQTRMDTIGNNIANVNTTGFKASRTTFVDAISQNMSGAAAPKAAIGGVNPKQVGLGVAVSSIDLLFSDGVTQGTGKNTDLALSGNGLFVVKNGDSTLYTRNGAFEFDADGNYVLPSSGYYVQGWMATEDGSLYTSGTPTNITIPSNKGMDAKVSAKATYTGNLNSAIPTVKTVSDAAGTGVASATNPGTLTMSDGTTSVQTSGTYVANQSLPVTTTLSYYDSLGNAHNVPVYFTNTAKNSTTGNTWSVQLMDANGTLGTSTTVTESDGTTTTINLPATTLTFDVNGALTGGTSATQSLTLTNGAGSISGGVMSGAQTVTLDFSALTQYSGTSTIAGKADGNAAGTLASVSIDSSGTITGVYSNNERRTEAQIAIAKFNNLTGLTKVGGSMYQESNNSGTANVKTATDLAVTVSSSSLELSNVDIANEFSDMIITQRGYQSNSKIITVSDEMLETLINMKR